MTRMLVYLAACGMGLGHAARLMAIARRIAGRAEVVFSTYGRAVQAVEESGYRCLKVRPISYEVDDEGDVDVRATIARGPVSIYSFLRQVGDELWFTGILKPDVLVSDSRLSSLVAGKARGLPTILIINQLKVLIPVKRPSPPKLRAKGLVEKLAYRVLRRGWNLADTILIPDYPPPYTVARANVLDEDVELPPKVRFIGPVLNPWPEELPPKEEARRQLGLSGRLIVASFTGVGGEGSVILDSFMKLLPLCPLPEDVTVVISRGVPSARPRVERLGERVYIYDWLPNRALYVKAADALVTHGGHNSVLEAIAFGTPALHMVQPTHTERLNNSRSAEALGVARLYVLGEDPERFCSALLWCLGDEAREKAEGLGATLAGYRGDVEAGKLILSLGRRG